MTDSMIVPRMKITDLMQRKARGPTAATQAPGAPGGHKFWCSICNGFRTHAVKLVAPNEAIKSEILRELALQKEGTRLEVRLSRTQETPSLKARLAIVCRSCGKTSVLVYQAGVWMPEVWGSRLDAHVRRRTVELLDQFDKALMAAVTESPVPAAEAEESEIDSRRTIGDVVQVQIDAWKLHRRAIAAKSGELKGKDAKVGHGDAGDTAVSVQGIRGKKLSPPAAENPVPSPRTRKHGPGIGTYLVLRAAYRQRHPMPARTKAKVLGWALSVPFLLMGALYVLAWNGFYVWLIYYAIKPYWQPWMNEWWFAALSLIVPGAYAIVYYRRFAPLPAMPTSVGLHMAANLKKYTKLASGTPLEKPDWWNKE